MRPTIEIICDVTDCKPVTLDECKMALIALSGMDHFVTDALHRLSDAILEDKPPAVVKFSAAEARKLITSMFDARKKDPLVWLGPANTPGTPEHAERQRLARNIFKKATGLDIDDPRSFADQEQAKRAT
jgi:hypothetical protein